MSDPTGPARLRRRLADGAALVLALATGLEVARAEAGAPLFLADSQFDDLRTRIFAVEPSSGAMTPIAELGTAHTPVLALAAADGSVLYAAGTDTSGRNLCGGARSCVLLRIVLDPASTTPAEVVEVGPVRSDGAIVTEIVGMSFRDDGTLYATSQATEALYTIDPATGEATRVGTVDLDLDGGDITFEADGRLMAWNNLGAQSGLYELDPATAEATVFELHPSLGMAGMAALGHSNLMYGAAPAEDKLYEMDSALGLTGVTVPLTLGGARFDHKRGDLDSPFCVADAGCEDDDPCTADRCTPGGCRREAVPGCCVVDADCGDDDLCTAEICVDLRCASEPVAVDDGDPCTLDSCSPETGPAHLDLREVDGDADGVSDCEDSCPGTPASEPVGPGGCSVAQLCPCEGPGRPWTGQGEYVSCVAKAAREVFRGVGLRAGARGWAVRTAARSTCGRAGAEPSREEGRRAR